MILKVLPIPPQQQDRRYHYLFSSEMIAKKAGTKPLYGGLLHPLFCTFLDENKYYSFMTTPSVPALHSVQTSLPASLTVKLQFVLV